MHRPHITIREILLWADEYFAHWGRWPTRESGAVTGQIDVTWCGIDIALRKANRGLPGGSSLAWTEWYGTLPGRGPRETIIW